MSDSPSSVSSSSAASAPARVGWWQALRLYSQPASVRMLLLGFSAGLPLLLVLGTLSFRLREAGIDRSTVGYLSWVGLAYGFKWMWSPLVDRLALPWMTRWLGQRRSWLLLAQCGVIAGLALMAELDPRTDLTGMAWAALLVAFSSATQDIALDAYRIESATPETQSVLAATYQTGYRLAMIWAGAGVLWLAAGAEMHAPAAATGASSQVVSPQSSQHDKGDGIIPPASESMPMSAPVPASAPAAVAVAAPASGTTSASAASTQATPAHPYQNSAWRTAYGVMAVSMLLGVAVVLFSPEPAPRPLPPAQNMSQWLQGAIVAPFADFFMRYRWHALLILALIALYRISDMVLGIMANPFYVDMRYSKEQVALITKVWGVVFTLLGTFIGGVLAVRLGVMRVLMVGTSLSACTHLLFAWLSTFIHLSGDVWPVSVLGMEFGMHKIVALTGVIVADNLASGITTAAFITYLSGLTSVSYSATQYALFSSLMLLLPKFIAGFSGKFVDMYGYTTFFISASLLGLPVLLLVFAVNRVVNQRRLTQTAGGAG